MCPACILGQGSAASVEVALHKHLFMVKAQGNHPARQNTSSHHENMVLAEYIPASTTTSGRWLPYDTATQSLLQKRQDWNHSGLSWTELGLCGHLRLGLSYHRQKWVHLDPLQLGPWGWPLHLSEHELPLVLAHWPLDWMCCQVHEDLKLREASVAVTGRSGSFTEKV